MEFAVAKSEILEKFKTLFADELGIVGWLTHDTDPIVFERLSRIQDDPLTAVQLNQLLTLSHEAPMSFDFFRYYWLEIPSTHPYNVESIPSFNERWGREQAIVSLDQLFWGLYRVFVDSLLFFGNIRTGYRKLRSLSRQELRNFLEMKRIPTERIQERGPALALRAIPIDDRYLISEMACKSYGDGTSPGDLKEVLLDSFRRDSSVTDGPVRISQLLDGEFVRKQFAERQQEFRFSADDVLEELVATEEELTEKISRVTRRFESARMAARENTKLYLSMASSLDVYVATSMRARQDFRNMANDCQTIFSDERLRHLNLRYFDPTLSAAAGHEDKGLIECLMVRCAKVLVFCAGERDSFGKDVEAAKALSQGKPVIFYCSQEARSRFYREVHPLSRLIDFKTGVAVGAIVTDSIHDISELLYRLFTNRMEYVLEQKAAYFRLRERSTNSVVRLQTNDKLLAETFWNHYHNRDSAIHV